jgi:endonuclease YncB( thermonuclease family)
MKISFGVTRFLALSVGALLSVAAIAADTISGKVVGVADGDTITVLVAGHDQVKIRLANIDAPEKAQPFGQRSKQALSDLAFGKAIECNQSGLDRYGRTIAVCSVGSTVINLAMVKAGMAWVYRKYAHNVPDYYAAEDEAHRKRFGLWADLDPVPPWAWRRQAGLHHRQH